MSKWLKILFISSIVLNGAFAIGAVWARSYVRTKSFEFAAMSAETECRFARHILKELESGEPDRIEALKKRLEKGIEQAEEVADIWRDAAKR
ncbi:hypothetical protein ACFL5Z_02685 [Planctomycetota bacterium]